MVALHSVVWPDPRALFLALFGAVSFTALTAIHSTVFSVRVVRAIPETSDWGRRQFLAGLLSVGAVAFVSAFAFGMLPRRALAQGNSFCVRLCKALFPPGRARGQCISEGARGRGPCAEGPCVPAPDAAQGFKPKTDQQTKLAKLLQNSTIPSTLAGSFFRLAHRFHRGRAPANALEASVFSVLDGLSPDVQAVLECSLQRFDTIPLEDRLRLFGQEFAELVDAPVSVDSLAPLVAAELVQRASLATFGNPECLTNERPGQPRPWVAGIDPILGFLNVISRVNGLRTITFRRPPGEPPFTAAELTSEEVEQQCSVDAAGHLDCQIQTTDCPGQSLGGVCLRVPQVLLGDAVLLEGFNFFDVDARVVLTAKPPGVVVREVDAHVCGDITTPVTEIVDGQERVIADSRVKDMLSFTVPTDLPDGIYFVSVHVPNTVGDPCCTAPEYQTLIPPSIRVVPAPTATFQIASEELVCVSETDAFIIGEAGSDEVAIQITTIPIGLDRSMGDMLIHGCKEDEDCAKPMRFGDVDSGERRNMARVLFEGSNIGGLSMAIVGFEVDNDDAYKEMVDDFWEAFALALQSQWNVIASSLESLASTIAIAAGLTPWVAAIAGLV
jgi:hypothetical protein